MSTLSTSSTPGRMIMPDQDGATVDVVPVLATSEPAVESDRIALLQETAQVAKRQVVAGTVRISTQTETYDEVAEVVLDRDRVDVTRVPVGKLVEVSPAVRTEGNTTIVPVMEERFVVVKQLFLKEELHIRHHVEQEVSRVPVQLRRQTAVVERLDGDGHAVADQQSL